jgi:hypothetical protein
MSKNIDCGSCRLLGRTIPWAFLIVGALISISPLGPNFQRSAAYLTVLALVLLAGSYLLANLTPGARKF